MALGESAAKDVHRIWSALDFGRLRETWPGWLATMSATLTGYHQQSADDAALFYRATRQLELGDPGAAKVADPLPAEQVARSLGYSAAGVFNQRMRAGASPAVAQEKALTQTLGTSTRIVMDGQRSTVAQSAAADVATVGWYFKTKPDPCYFCALLASRGVVHHGDSFVLSDVRFVGEGTAKVHDHCRCILAPAFSRSMTLPAVATEAKRVYKDRGDGDPLNAFRKAWDARHTA